MTVEKTTRFYLYGFLTNLFKCPKCQGCMRVIAFIEDEDDYVIDPDTPVEANF